MNPSLWDLLMAEAETARFARSRTVRRGIPSDHMPSVNRGRMASPKKTKRKNR